MSISTTVKTEVASWRDNIYTSYRNLEEIPITDTIYTYTSSYGKGARYKDQRKSRRWIENAKLQSIDNLELLTVKLASHFSENFRNRHIRIISDNMMIIAYINFFMTQVPII